jgi:hypothetical protein
MLLLFLVLRLTISTASSMSLYPLLILRWLYLNERDELNDHHHFLPNTSATRDKHTKNREGREERRRYKIGSKVRI